MRRVGRGTYTEIYFWGCNPGYVSTDDGVVLIDTPQQPKDALRWREAVLEHGPVRYLINTEPHPDHIMGNAYFPGTEVIGQVDLQARYNESIPRLTAPSQRDALKGTDPDSVWLFNHPDYPPNPPTTTFTDRFDLEVGGRRIACLHMPGHTPSQTSVFLPDDGLIFTGDNVFRGCMTWLQDADPWRWLAALDEIAALDIETIIPGHGEPCTKDYLATQAQVIRNWVGFIEELVDQGVPEDEGSSRLTDIGELDPYPIGQRLFPMQETLVGWNVRNLYRQVAERRQSSAERGAGG